MTMLLRDFSSAIKSAGGAGAVGEGCRAAVLAHAGLRFFEREMRAPVALGGLGSSF